MIKSFNFVFILFLTWQGALEALSQAERFEMVQWVPNQTFDSQSDTSLSPGFENGKPYFIGRAAKNGKGNIPGKVVDGVLFLVINGTEEDPIYGNFEILKYKSEALSWKEIVIETEGENDDLPENLFAGGSDPDTEEILYICRAWHLHHLIIGKFSKSSKRCQVGLFGKEHLYEEYSVLVWNQSESQVQAPCTNEGKYNTWAIVIFLLLFVILATFTIFHFQLWARIQLWYKLRRNLQDQSGAKYSASSQLAIIRDDGLEE